MIAKTMPCWQWVLWAQENQSGEEPVPEGTVNVLVVVPEETGTLGGGEGRGWVSTKIRGMKYV